MNIYDEAHGLARAIEKSMEMQRLIQAKQALDKEQETAKMVRRYLTLQMEVEYRRMLGQTPEEKTVNEYRELHVLVENNSQAREYIEALSRWHVIMSDVQKIIGDAMKAGTLDFDMPEADGK